MSSPLRFGTVSHRPNCSEIRRNVLFHGGYGAFCDAPVRIVMPCFGTPSQNKGMRSFSTPLQGVAHNGYRSRQGDSTLESPFEGTHIIGWDGILPPHLQGRPYFKAYHATHEGVVIHDALCPKTGHRVQTRKCSMRGALRSPICRRTVIARKIQ